MSEPPAVDTISPAEMHRAAVQGAAWTAVQSWGFNAGSFVVFVILGRLLTPADFGIVAAAYTVTMFFRAVVDAGFNRLLVQRRELPRIYADTAFWTAVALAIALTAISIATAPYFALLFGIPGLTIVIRALSPIFILGALDSTQSALLDRRMQFRTQAIRRLAAAIVAGVTAISLAVAGAGVWALVAQQLVLETVTVGLLWALAPWRPRARVSRAAFQELAPFGARITSLKLAAFAMEYGDNFFVGIAFGKVWLGYYVVAYRMYSVVNDLVMMVINRVALATFSRLQHERALVKAAFYRASRLGSLVSLPAYVGLALVAPQVIAALFGARWLPSVPLLQVLTVAAFAQGQLGLCGAYVTAIGRIRNEFRWAICLAVVQLVAFAVAARFSVFAVAASVGIVLMGAWPIRLLLLREVGAIQLKAYFAHYPRLIASTVVMAVGVAAVRREVAGIPPVAAMVAEIATGVILLAAAMQIVAPGLVSEIKQTARTLRTART